MNTTQTTHISAAMTQNGFTTLVVGDRQDFINAASPDDAAARIRAIAQRHAAETGHQVDVDVTMPDGTCRHETITTPAPPAEDPPKTEQPSTAADEPTEAPPEALPPAPEPVDPEPAPEPEPTPAPEEQAADPVPTVTAPEPPRRSFLAEQPVEPVATTGWRGVLARRGLHVAPSEAERAERADVHAVSQHWPGPRTIFVANGKGGAGKTPSVVLLSAVFARYGGAGVLALDANQTRGTLGWRSEQGPHEATILDLMPQIDRLLGTGAQSADLAHYVHHQTADRYDVLRSQPLALAAEQRVTPQAIDRVWQVAAKYYRLVIIDNGNDESDPVWLAALAHADQLVVPTTTRGDHAEAGALLLDALRHRDEHSAALADTAVVVATQADPTASRHDIDSIVSGYQSLARAVVTIPHDPAMVDGSLQWDSLRGPTRRAWLRAAAAVAQGL